MGLVSILLAGLIIIFSSYYLLTNLGSSQNNNSTATQQTPIDQAKDVQIKADFQAIQTSLNLYKAQNGKYPDSLQDLSDQNFFHGSFKNPYTQVEYSYEVTGNNYTLSTNLGNNNPYQVSN